MAAIPLTRTHRVLDRIRRRRGAVIAAIGFAGSYAAVRELAEAKRAPFSLVFPIGIDAGICVLLALDLLLYVDADPVPAAAPDGVAADRRDHRVQRRRLLAGELLLGTAMHAVIPCLFVVSVEALPGTRWAGSRTSRPTSTWRACASPAGCSPPYPRSSCGGA
ncbi:hypothetical protein STANM309S_02653 [Streptomyces tanashiensis]